MKKLLLGTALGATLACGAAGMASAAVIELALAVDASGSINASEWQLQMQGYANAITAALPTDGTVAVSVIRFANTATVVRSMTEINSAADLADLAGFFTTLNQFGDGNLTCITCAIEAANSTFDSDPLTKAVIDVSTDDVYTEGFNPNSAADVVGSAEWAVANNTDVVNALGIGTASPPDFAHGEGSFSMLTPDFEQFEAALIAKLRRETGQEVPEPAALGMFGAMLAGLGLIARRRRA